MEHESDKIKTYKHPKSGVEIRGIRMPRGTRLLSKYAFPAHDGKWGHITIDLHNVTLDNDTMLLIDPR